MVGTMSVDESLGNGVFFARDSYAGLMRRILVMLIDGMVLIAAGVAIWVPLVMLLWDPQTGRTPDALFFMLWTALIWFYLTIIKRSRCRTVAYRLLGLQIVTTCGTRPTLAVMTLRLLIWVFGPFSFILDLLWVGVDTEQQTLRDCYAGTYVVRANSQPVGVGPMHLTRYFGAGLALSYPRVIRPASDLASS